MSESIPENTSIEEIKPLTFKESINIINDKYLSFLNELLEKFKYHEHLSGSLESDIKIIKDNLVKDNFEVIDIITDNFLFCLEQISDHNSDYFIYQKEKIQKKNGEFYKNKLPKVGSKTLLKKVLNESEPLFLSKIFKEITDIFHLLTLKDDDDLIIFNEEYIYYVKENFCENKNFSKMIMVFDNINNILDSTLEEIHESELKDNQETNSNDEEEVSNKNKNSKKNKKNKSKKSNPLGADFLKGFENTKIAQLAKNISEKINIDDFPSLTDPSKLLSSLSNPSDENGAGGIQNLLKFVIGEVEDAFKGNTLNEKDLATEAQNIMGQFQNLSGFDPMSLLNNKDSMNQFADIFSKMGK